MHYSIVNDDNIIDVYDNGYFLHKTGQFTPMSPYGRKTADDYDPEQNVAKVSCLIYYRRKR